MRQKRIVILVGPSGAGKSTLVERLTKDCPELVTDLVTCTTRPMRPGEAEGNPYHFFTEERFKELIDEGYFVEWALVHNDYKGTSKGSIERIWDEGQTALVDVDIQGARTFSQIYPKEAFSIFILPPSIDELRRRVMDRDDGGTSDLDLRMKNAMKEIRCAEEFNYQVVNSDLDKAYAEMKEIILKELKKT